MPNKAGVFGSGNLGDWLYGICQNTGKGNKSTGGPGGWSGCSPPKIKDSLPLSEQLGTQSRA